MSARILLRKATRIEGNANIQIEVEDGRVKNARFVVPDFRGFEKIMQAVTLDLSWAVGEDTTELVVALEVRRHMTR